MYHLYKILSNLAHPPLRDYTMPPCTAEMPFQNISHCGLYCIPLSQCICEATFLLHRLHKLLHTATSLAYNAESRIFIDDKVKSVNHAEPFNRQRFQSVLKFSFLMYRDVEDNASWTKKMKLLSFKQWLLLKSSAWILYQRQFHQNWAIYSH